MKYEGNNQLANTSVPDSPSPQQGASELVSGLIGRNDLYTLYYPSFFHSQINPIPPRTEREREREREGEREKERDCTLKHTTVTESLYGGSIGFSGVNTSKV